MFENGLIENFEFGGKDVYVFESHNFALIPWAEISNSLTETPYLITLDYHTDTHHAFQSEAYHSANGDYEAARVIRTKLCGLIDKTKPHSVFDAAVRLRHDEHIHAAICAGIVSHSFSIQYMDSLGTTSREQEARFERMRNDPAAIFRGEIPDAAPPFSYNVPDDGMFVVPNGCAIGCPRAPHTDECIVPHANQALEDVFLQDKLDCIQLMSCTSGLGTLQERPYILDIDLDYFRTRRAAQPLTTSVFYQLIQHAAAITIARESLCVEMLRLPGEDISSEELQSQVLSHVQKAMSHS